MAEWLDWSFGRRLKHRRTPSTNSNRGGPRHPLGFRVQGFRGLGFRGLGFRGLGV